MSAQPGPETAAPQIRSTTRPRPTRLRRHWCGRWRTPDRGGDAHTTYAPFTGQPVASLALSTPEEVVSATAAARAAQREWARVPLESRAQVLLNLHDLVLDRQADILDLIQWESGKARKHAFEEVAQWR